jgi:hypothetical protein
MPQKKIKHGSWNPNRTDKIIHRYRQGETIRHIATVFNLSYQRVHQIIVSHIPNEIRPRGPSDV